MAKELPVLEFSIKTMTHKDIRYIPYVLRRGQSMSVKKNLFNSYEADISEG